MMEEKNYAGNEAFARGAYEAGVKVVSSYPGTPSTEVTETLAKYDEIHVEWAPNEKVGVEVAMGASVGGVRALSCMKHVGLNVAALTRSLQQHIQELREELSSWWQTITDVIPAKMSRIQGITESPQEFLCWNLPTLKSAKIT